ncbi:hypothetical protein TNCT6_20630 [Streptomyces sp. 6-11-2]|nr:hypothetical protein TNCT6_20630 [Streptomyces sp. 6-11-2]
MCRCAGGGALRLARAGLAVERSPPIRSGTPWPYGPYGPSGPLATDTTGPPGPGPAGPPPHNRPPSHRRAPRRADEARTAPAPGRAWRCAALGRTPGRTVPNRAGPCAGPDMTLRRAGLGTGPGMAAGRAGQGAAPR